MQQTKIPIQVVLPEELTEQLRAEAHSAIAQGIEAARKDYNLGRAFLKQKYMIQWLGISHKTFKQWKAAGMPVIYMDGATLYSKTQVTSWLESQAI